MKRRRNSSWTITSYERCWWSRRHRKWWDAAESDDDRPSGVISSHAQARTKKKALRIARSLLRNTSCTQAVVTQWFYRKGVRCTRDWLMGKGNLP